MKIVKKFSKYLLLTVLVLQIFHASASQAEYKCRPSPLKGDINYFFKDIEKVILVVDVYPIFFRKISDICIKDSDCKDIDFKWPFLATDDLSHNLEYSAIARKYPAPLYWENLKEIFYERVRYEFVSFVLSDIDACKNPTFIVTDKQGLGKLPYLNPGVLVIDVAVNFNHMVNPGIAAMSLSFHRPDMDSEQYEISLRLRHDAFGISTNRTDDEIENDIKDFANSRINIGILLGRSHYGHTGISVPTR